LGSTDPALTYEISGLPVDSTLGTDFGNTITILGYDTGISMLAPYGSDYIKLYDFNKLGLIKFDGDDTATVTEQWMWNGSHWYSGASDERDVLIAATANVDVLDPTLEITTYWDIEDYWDFGFVQVSTDGGMTWTSLENMYTTYTHDPAAMASIVANLPGLTGWSMAYVTMTFDLTAYAGQEIMVGFRFMTDWATVYEGWYITAATVSGTSILTDLAPIPPEADFLVTAVHAFVGGPITTYVPCNMRLNDLTEEGMTFGFLKPKYTLLIVSSVGRKGLVDYEFSADRMKGFWCKIFG
jgi:hypothetical protein